MEQAKSGLIKQSSLGTILMVMAMLIMVIIQLPPFMLDMFLLPTPVFINTLPLSVLITKELSPKLIRFHLSGFMYFSHTVFGSCPKKAPPSYFIVPSLIKWKVLFTDLNY